ncbi:M16 family metallopeptidase [Polyangium aurulentum]|uniref:M16 family metallopeptidase n=1 Tax=Polyangium aurulentum TaxID=2567896 RepID=UPI00146E14C6|nr:pitrilysin family protein [Polyangium aurulentum]UQA57655.1 insulinase family protein [Polyangium aurulentum]
MKKSIFTLTLALLLGAAPAALAEKQAPPPAATPKPFTVPATKDFTLSNGLAVTLVPFGAIPKVSIELSVRAGNVDEAENEQAIADLLGELLLEGTTTKTAEEIARGAAQMGGSVSASVGLNYTSIRGEALSDFAPDIVRLLADVALNPKLPASEVPRLTADLVRGVAQRKADPSDIADVKLYELLYAGHPYGRPLPTEATLKSHTAEKARAFYERLFGAKRAHLYVAGLFDLPRTEAAIREAFAGMRPLETRAEATPKAKTARAITLIDRPGAVQSVVAIATPAIDPAHPDALALEVANTLLGGYFGSRITANIREQKGYTYSPRSSITDLLKTSFWEQYAEITTNVTGPAIKEVFAEIDRMQAEPPAKAELAGVKSYMIGTFTLKLSSRFGIIGQLRRVDQHGLPREYLSTYVDRVLALKPEDVQRVTKQYIEDDKATIVIVGDRKQIEKQIAPFGKIQ